MTYKVSRCVRCPCGRDNGVEQPALTGRLIGPGQEGALQQLQPSGRHQRLCGDHRAVSGADREQRMSGVEAVVALRPPQLGLGGVRRRLGRRLRPPSLSSLVLTALLLATTRKGLVCALPPYVSRMNRNLRISTI